jgi:signal transduction histidine kinase
MAPFSDAKGARLPFILVLFSLISAIVLPRLAENRVTSLRNEINDVADPARLRVTDILLDLALQASQRRGYLLSDDNALGRAYTASRERRLESERQLLDYARQLDDDGPPTIGAVAGRLHRQTARLDSMVSMPGAASSPTFDAQRREFIVIRSLADTLATAIDSASTARRRAIDRTENLTRLLTAGLVLLGLGASFVVARLGLRYRDLLVAERAAREVAEQRRSELERVTESRGRLLRGFTHDVKNPLSAADGYLSLLEDGLLGELGTSQRTTINKVRRSIRHALELIARLLDLARAESGQLELNWCETDLTEELRDVTDAFLPQAKAKGLALDIALPEDLPHIETDTARLRQVVGNLVSNAVKYTPPGGHIAVRAGLRRDTAEQPQVLVTVSDDGPGIPEEKLPLVFMEFTRFDASAAEGAGIGLAISQKIAQALGGHIDVESRVGSGSKFILRLPVAPVNVPAAGVDHR